MNKMILMLVAAFSLSGCATHRIAPPPKNHIPQVVAVTSFENKSGFSGQWELGRGMADVLTSELIKTKYYTVVERRELRNVFTEIDLQKDPNFRKEGKVNNGRLINAKYLIRGSITDFAQVGGGAVSVLFKQLLFGGRGYNAKVAITITVIDVETGEIIDAVQCEGDARARDVFAKGEYEGVSFGGNAYFKTPLGSATKQAIREALETITKLIPIVTWEPQIAEVAGDTVIINGGTKQGLQENMIYDVREPGRPVTDPISGNVISIIPGSVVGTIQVTGCEATAARARIISGKGLQRAQRLILRK